ncbi:MAG: hypothetical protein PHE63_02945 [Eubacteriales bacterium]|nr:hypothetical protein [Eubacteriales bacterium]
MHSYTVDSKERERIPLYLAIISVIFTWTFSKYILNPLAMAFSISVWWVDTPAVLGFYGICYKIFDLYLWKVKLLRELLGIKVPDLNGVWNVILKSSYDDFSEERYATITIQQTWTSISIRFENETSSSFSRTASIYTNDLSGAKLSYEYQNSPNADTVDTMNIHIGFVCLRILEKNSILDGEYFSNSGRKNYGRISIRRNEIQAAR